jgi:hypothetical protein
MRRARAAAAKSTKNVAVVKAAQNKIILHPFTSDDSDDYYSCIKRIKTTVETL